MSILFMVDFVFFKTKYFRGFLPIPNYTVLLLMIVKMAIESCNLHWLLIACCYQLPYHDVRNVFFALSLFLHARLLKNWPPSMFVIHQKKLELKKNNAKNPSQIGLQIIIFLLDPHIWIMYIFFVTA